jgi:hypothetical protein
MLRIDSGQYRGDLKIVDISKKCQFRYSIKEITDREMAEKIINEL